MKVGTGTTLLIILACLIIGGIISIVYSFWINNKLKRGLFSKKAVNELFEKK